MGLHTAAVTCRGLVRRKFIRQQEENPKPGLICEPTTDIRRSVRPDGGNADHAEAMRPPCRSASWLAYA